MYKLPGISFVTETCRIFSFEMYLAHNLIKCYKTVNDSKTEDSMCTTSKTVHLLRSSILFIGLRTLFGDAQKVP